ncbi:hypothetical protein [Legionella hackeliae]|uniref:Transmembrane protein n=1 Tax=Legionella hackeliae TaxID=449 RepID=A0A0A8UVZ6_LEGHA|nr:hypothetical protein [Legionella hackeliae]KTD15376.1 hypothetical protein Lhac_0218 [Legionella hackeliae]CEK11257.1 membrane protein of unknown function [Legionella hackeliae]STX48022.1 Uncharacterised protein [Legionella hackeliae]
MYHFLRTVLLILVWLSLLVIPYAFISYVCYEGLCGGGAAGEVRSSPFYLKIWGYYMWLYPFIVFGALYLSRRARLSGDFTSSLSILLIPLLGLLPLLYVSFQIGKINKKYTDQETAYYTAQANDFVCAPGKFIRTNKNQFYYFATAPGQYGKSRTVTYFNDYAEIESFLKNNEIDSSQCKNQQGASFYSLKNKH